MKIFEIEYFNKLKEIYEPVTIKSFSYSKTNLTFTFEEYLTYKAHSNIRIKTIYPLNKFYNSSTSKNNSLFFKNQTLILEIKKIEIFSEELKIQEKKLAEAEKIAETPATILSGTAVGVTTVASFSGSSFVFFIKFFQILEILSNLEKMNVKLGNNLEIVLVFISRIELPEIKFLAKLSPIDDLEDTEGEYKDRELYLQQINGQRGKMIEKNRDVFIIYGQNFILSFLMLSTWIISILVSICLKGDNWFKKTLITLYRTLLGFFYFDFQLICVTEIASRNIFKDQPLSLRISYLTSMAVVSMIFIDLLRAYHIIKKRRRDKENDLDYDEKMILSMYTDEMCEEAIDRAEMYLVIDNARFLIIQIFVATFQLLNRFQATLIVIFNLIYFIQVVKKLASKKIFGSKFTTVKFITSEISIMIVLINIFVFSLTENSDFHKSDFYNLLEIISIICILIAVVFELIHVIKSSVSMIMNICRKKKNNLKSRKVFPQKKKKIVDEKEKEEIKEDESGKEPNQIDPSMKKLLNEKKIISKGNENEMGNEKILRKENEEKLRNLRNKMNFRNARPGPFMVKTKRALKNGLFMKKVSD